VDSGSVREHLRPRSASDCRGRYDLDQNGRVDIRDFDGDREMLRPLFRRADDSEQAIDRDLLAGLILVAVDAGAIVGNVQIADTSDERTLELKSMAVVDARRGEGVGRALIEEAKRRARHRGAQRLLVATAAADTGNLRFYQRLQFRLLRVERDAFGNDAGYTDGILIDGIPLRDRVWLDLEL
jgi:GNAT superfamily N-acetyltransferase